MVSVRGRCHQDCLASWWQKRKIERVHASHPCLAFVGSPAPAIRLHFHISHMRPIPCHLDSTGSYAAIFSNWWTCREKERKSRSQIQTSFFTFLSLNYAAIFRPSSLRMYSKSNLRGIFCRSLRITFKNLNFRMHWRIRYFFRSQLPSNDSHDMWCAVIACVERLNISTLRQLSIASGDDTNLPREPHKHIRDI